LLSLHQALDDVLADPLFPPLFDPNREFIGFVLEVLDVMKLDFEALHERHVHPDETFVGQQEDEFLDLEGRRVRVGG
jgi:hypothetical protein